MKNKVKILKALGDETRLSIVQYLLGGERCACAILPSVKKAQPTVSRHLKILVEAGILKPRRKGVNIWYKIKSKDAVRVVGSLGIRRINNRGRGC